MVSTQEKLYIINYFGHILLQTEFPDMVLSMLTMDHIVFVCSENHIMSYNLETNKKNIIKSPRDSISSVAIMGRKIILGYSDGRIEICDKDLSTVYRNVKGHNGIVTSVDTFHDKLISSSGTEIKIWSKELTLISGFILPNPGSKISIQKNYILWHDYDRTIYRYYIYENTIEIIKPLDAENYENRIISTAKNGKGKLITRTLGGMVTDSIRFPHLISSFSVTSDQKEILVGTIDGKVSFIDNQTGKLIKCIEKEYFIDLTTVAINSENDLYAAASSHGIGGLYRISDGSTETERAQGFISFNKAYLTSTGETNTMIFVSSSDLYLRNSLYITAFKTVQNKKNAALKDYRFNGESFTDYFFTDYQPITATSLVPGSNIIILAFGRKLSFFDYVQKVEIRSEPVKDNITSLYITPDTADLFVGDELGYIRKYSISRDLWDDQYLINHNSSVVSLTSTPRGDTIISASVDSIKIWSPFGRLLNTIGDSNIQEIYYSSLIKKLVYSTENFGDVKTVTDKNDASNTNTKAEPNSRIYKVILTNGAIYTIMYDGKFFLFNTN